MNPEITGYIILLALGAVVLAIVFAIISTGQLQDMVKDIKSFQFTATVKIGSSEGTPTSTNPVSRHPDLAHDDARVLDESKPPVGPISKA